ncbi:MAG: Rho termination factor N-terminal domain-containing protein [Aphanocapsa sp. GSE-SYN-MK-11-07L]|jgi:uncharacterized protein (UPF0147 family)|nr:Rho termination factor N-terminal domain-containing protein [Aphanocapsa sp. GSE-SYN-MK-11-07L]
MVIEGGKLSYESGKFLRVWLHQCYAIPENIQSTVHPEHKVIYLLPPAKDIQTNYSAMTIRELKRIARDRHIPNYGRMTKAQLVKTLTVTYQ